VSWIQKKTLHARHRIVKLIAPKLYNDATSLTLFRLQNIIPRPMILYVKQLKGNNPLVGVEIGVAQGINTESILETLNIKKLFLVDPYKPYYQKGELWIQYVKSYEEAVKRLNNYSSKVTFIRLPSHEVAKIIPNELDFVYIDGNHDYEYVKMDIEDYYPKIKRGGVLGGHDFYGDFLGVCRAVVEFANKNKLELITEKVDWWIEK